MYFPLFENSEEDFRRLGYVFNFGIPSVGPMHVIFKHESVNRYVIDEVGKMLSTKSQQKAWY
jgi:hypothetical protein